MARKKTRGSRRESATPNAPPSDASDSSPSRSSSRSSSTSHADADARAAAGADGEPIRIRKYPNRRMYDTSRSTHITMDELYDLIATGHPVQVVDSRTGQDITNQTLAMALIERDPDKLRLFPSWMLHYMISSREQVLVQFFNQYWSVLINAFMAAQPHPTSSAVNPFASNESASPFPFNVSAFGPPPNRPGIGKPIDPASMFNPLAWMSAMTGSSPQPSRAPNFDSDSESDSDTRNEARDIETQSDDDEIAELQREVSELARRLAELTGGKK